MTRQGEVHDCLQHLLLRERDYADNLDPEVDGAIERWYERWWECEECGEKFTDKEVEEMQKEAAE